MACIVMDPSHGGEDFGDVYGCRLEKDDNLRLALAVGDLLRRNGIKVYYTRTTDITLPEYDRYNKYKNKNVDMMISFHRYHHQYVADHCGIQTIILDKDGLARKASNNIGDKLKRLGYKTFKIVEIQAEGTSQKEIFVPELKLLLGFINSDTDNKIFDERFEEITSGIANGIMEAMEYRQRDCTSFACKENVLAPYYRILAGSFVSYQDAISCQQFFICQGYAANIVAEDRYYAVSIGELSDLDEAAKLETAVRKLGYPTRMIQL